MFRLSLESVVERERDLNAEFSGYLDLVEVSLFEHIRKAQRDHLFDSLASLGEPLQQDLRRVQEVLQRLDCLEHVRECRPSIQMLLQGRDFITALDLIDSTTSAVDSNLKGVVSVQSIWNQLVNLGETFDRAAWNQVLVCNTVEAEFVHQSSEEKPLPLSHDVYRCVFDEAL
eukprot:Skav204816  [mRNA]  locus=scaffold3914:103083:110588:- [translate_table: standard]